jgi:hypothetical protein
MDFAVAGWLHTGYGPTFIRDVLPCYEEDIASTHDRQSHYHTYNDAIIHDILNQQLSEEQLLEISVADVENIRRWPMANVLG